MDEATRQRPPKRLPSRERHANLDSTLLARLARECRQRLLEPRLWCRRHRRWLDRPDQWPARPVGLRNAGR
jgi:hypothetical protein